MDSFLTIPINGCVESREKGARALYFLTRFVRYRIDKHKLTTKDFIRWHKLSQILERIEQNLCAVFRFLWLGNPISRIIRLKCILEAVPSEGTGSGYKLLLSLYSFVTLIDESIEDYLSIQQARYLSGIGVTDASGVTIGGSNMNSRNANYPNSTSSPPSLDNNHGAGNGINTNDNHTNSNTGNVSCQSPDKNSVSSPNVVSSSECRNSHEGELDLWGINRSLLPRIVEQISSSTAFLSTILRIMVCLVGFSSGTALPNYNIMSTSSMSGSGSTSGINKPSLTQKSLVPVRLFQFFSVTQLAIDMYLMTLNFCRTFRIPLSSAIRQWSGVSNIRENNYLNAFSVTPFSSPQLFLTGLASAVAGLLKSGC